MKLDHSFVFSILNLHSQIQAILTRPELNYITPNVVRHQTVAIKMLLEIYRALTIKIGKSSSLEILVRIPSVFKMHVNE